MVTSSGDNNWPKELRNGLQLADDDIIRGGLDIVTDKKIIINRRQSKKPPSLQCLVRTVKIYDGEPFG